MIAIEALVIDDHGRIVKADVSFQRLLPAVNVKQWKWDWGTVVVGVWHGLVFE